MKKKAREEAAFNLGALCLNSIHEGDSGRRTERDIAMLTRVWGIEAGDINHSRRLRGLARDNLYGAMCEGLRRFFSTPADRTGRLPAVSVACDKMTVSRRTMLITAICALVDGELRAFVAPMQICGGDLSGDALLHALETAAGALLGDSMDPGGWISRVSSLPCDGEVRAKILPALERGGWPNVEVGEDGEISGWANVPWDDAHLVELARKDAATNELAQGWLDHVIGICSETHKKYGYGKQYELLLEARDELAALAEELGEDAGSKQEKWASTKAFSATRWATHEHRSLVAIVRIFPAMAHRLGVEAKELTPVTKVPSAAAKASAEFLEQVTGAGYVASLLGSTDTALHVGSLSQVLQTVAMAPWVRAERAREAVADLRSDARSIRGHLAGFMEGKECGECNPVGPDPRRLPLVAEIVEGMKGGGCEGKVFFRGVELRAREEGMGKKEVEGALGNVAQWLETVAQCVEERLGRPHWAIQLAGVAFRPQSLLGANVSKAESDAISELAGKAPLGLDSAAVVGEYMGIREELSNMESEGKFRMGGGRKKADHKAIFKAIFTEARLYKGREGVVHLLEHLILKGGVESVCESVGSVVKRRAVGCMDHWAISQETAIAWNTPRPYAPGAEALISRATDGINFARESKRNVRKWDVSKVVDRVGAVDPLAQLYQ